MTDPAIIDAVENSFVPLLIINNTRRGNDSQILKKYNEPAWNYQVIRFLDHNGKDVIPRKDGVNVKKLLANRMIQALKKAGKPVPDSLKEVK